MPNSTDIDLLHDALTTLTLRSEGISGAVARVEARDTFPYETEAAHLAQAVAHRQYEFMAGRDCARRALVALGFEAGPIVPDEDGVPLWPERCLGSISHSRGLCAAVAARADAYVCLGLDLEKTNRLSAGAIKRVVHPGEAEWVGDDQARASLLFSAKEAFYKAQFPKWRSPGNFHDLSLAVDESAGELHIQGISGQFPAALCERAGQFRFRFRYISDYVVTLCWLSD